MRRAEGPTLALALFLLPLAGRPVAAAPAAQLKAALSPAGQAYETELRGILEDLRGRLSANDAAGVAAVEARFDAALERGKARVPDAERAELEPLVQRVLGILRQLRPIEAAVPDPEFGRSMRGLVLSLDPAASPERVKSFEAAVGQLKDAAQDPARRNQVFDNMRRMFAGDAEAMVRIDKAQSAIGSADSVSTSVGFDGPKGLRTQAVPAAADLSELWKAEPEPFAGLDERARQAKFGGGRSARREALLREGGLALKEAGEDPARHADLASLDARLGVVHKAVLAELGLDGPDAGKEDEEARFRRLMDRAPGLALYALHRGMHQIFIQKAMKAGAIPENTSFDAWELAVEAQGGTGAAWEARTEGGVRYVGLSVAYADGSTRFEGLAGARSLMVIKDPRSNRELSTMVRADAQGQLAESRTSVIDSRTGKRIQEELVNIARQLTTITHFEDGVPVAVQTLDMRTGMRSVQDARTGRVVSVDDAGAATLSRADGKGPVTRGTMGPDGRFQPREVVLDNGARVVFLSQRVLMAYGRDGKLQGFEANLDRLFNGGLSGKDRAAEAAAVARDLVAALGEAQARFKNDKDGGYSRTLANWLADTFDASNGLFKSVRLTADPGGELVLVYEYKDGRSRIERAKFAASTPYKGKTQLALVVYTPISVDPSGKGQVDPNRWAEYLADGSKLQWQARSEFLDAGRADDGSKYGWYNPARYTTAARTIKRTYVRHLSRGADGRMAFDGEELKATLTDELPATSTLGIIGGAFYDAPVVGHILKGGEWAGKSIYIGVVSGAHEIIYAATGSEEYGLQASGGFSRSPLMNFLLDKAEGDHVKGHLNRLSRVQREVVEARAMESRRKWLEQNLNDPEERMRAMREPLSDDELMSALGYYGAGNLGRQLLDMSAESTGARKWALAGAGYAMRVGENITEGMANPVIWATFGAGRAVQALQAVSAGATASRWVAVSARLAGGTNRLLTAAKVTEGVLTTTLYGSWALGGADNLGQFVHNVNSGRWGESWEKAADVSTDLFFLGAMLRMGRGKHSKHASATLDARETTLKQRASLVEAQGRGPKGQAPSAKTAGEAPSAPAVQVEAQGRGPKSRSPATFQAKVQGLVNAEAAPVNIAARVKPAAPAVSVNAPATAPVAKVKAPSAPQAPKQGMLARLKTAVTERFFSRAKPRAVVAPESVKAVVPKETLRRAGLIEEGGRTPPQPPKPRLAAPKVAAGIELGHDWAPAEKPSFSPPPPDTPGNLPATGSGWDPGGSGGGSDPAAANPPGGSSSPENIAPRSPSQPQPDPEAQAAQPSEPPAAPPAAPAQVSPAGDRQSAVAAEPPGGPGPSKSGGDDKAAGGGGGGGSPAGGGRKGGGGGRGGGGGGGGGAGAGGGGGGMGGGAANAAPRGDDFSPSPAPPAYSPAPAPGPPGGFAPAGGDALAPSPRTSPRVTSSQASAAPPLLASARPMTPPERPAAKPPARPETPKPAGYSGASYGPVPPEMWAFGPKQPQAAAAAKQQAPAARLPRPPQRPSMAESAAPPEYPDEDFVAAVLPPSQHLVSSRGSAGRSLTPGRRLLSLLLQLSAAAALTYLWFYSELPYILGLRRRRGRG